MGNCLAWVDVYYGLLSGMLTCTMGYCLAWVDVYYGLLSGMG